MQASFSANTAAYAANTGNDECHVCYEDTVEVSQRQASSDQCDQRCTQACNVLAESLADKSFNELDLPTRQQMIDACSSKCCTSVKHLMGPPGVMGPCGQPGGPGSDGSQGPPGNQGVQRGMTK